MAIIVAECRDGIGPSNFVTWLQRYDRARLGPTPRTYVLPQGGLVFPWVRESDG